MRTRTVFPMTVSASQWYFGMWSLALYQYTPLNYLKADQVHFFFFIAMFRWGEGEILVKNVDCGPHQDLYHISYHQGPKIYLLISSQRYWIYWNWITWRHLVQFAFSLRYPSALEDFDCMDPRKGNQKSISLSPSLSFEVQGIWWFYNQGDQEVCISS